MKTILGLTASFLLGVYPAAYALETPKVSGGVYLAVLFNESNVKVHIDGDFPFGWINSPKFSVPSKHIVADERAYSEVKSSIDLYNCVSRGQNTQHLTRVKNVAVPEYCNLFDRKYLSIDGEKHYRLSYCSTDGKVHAQEKVGEKWKPYSSVSYRGTGSSAKSGIQVEFFGIVIQPNGDLKFVNVKQN